MDYPKNIYILNFGEENQGSTYYLSLSNMYQFGIVGYTTGFDILYYSVYQKDGINNGGDNSVSCLVDKFKDMAYFSDPCMGGIIICAHISGGQKNWIVMWFIIWLTETGFF